MEDLVGPTDLDERGRGPTWHGRVSVLFRAFPQRRHLVPDLSKADTSRQAAGSHLGQRRHGLPTLRRGPAAAGREGAGACHIVRGRNGARDRDQLAEMPPPTPSTIVRM